MQGTEPIERLRLRDSGEQREGPITVQGIIEAESAVRSEKHTREQSEVEKLSLSQSQRSAVVRFHTERKGQSKPRDYRRIGKG